MDQETKTCLMQAASKVRELRRHNEILQAKVDTMELLAGFVYARVPEPRSMGAEEDIAWRIDRLLAQAQGPTPQKVSP